MEVQIPNDIKNYYFLMYEIYALDENGNEISVIIFNTKGQYRKDVWNKNKFNGWSLVKTGEWK